MRNVLTVQSNHSPHSAVEWAEFPLIDLSKASTPEGLAELAPVVRDAMRTYGFLYVVNHGLSQAQVSV